MLERCLVAIFVENIMALGEELRHTSNSELKWLLGQIPIIFAYVWKLSEFTWNFAILFAKLVAKDSMAKKNFTNTDYNIVASNIIASSKDVHLKQSSRQICGRTWDNFTSLIRRNWTIVKRNLTNFTLTMFCQNSKIVIRGRNVVSFIEENGNLSSWSLNWVTKEIEKKKN